MARSRNIKPGFFTHEKMADNDPLGRLLFIGMTTISDFRGNLEWRPKRIKIQILPYDDCDLDLLAINLERSGFIRFYSDGNKTYVNIVNFMKHQNPHKNERESGTEIPDYTEEMHQAFDFESLAINRDKSRANHDKDGTARADSLNLIPDSLNPQPDSKYIANGQQAALSLPAVVSIGAEKPKAEKGITNETWDAYANAYRMRYGTDPIRNRSVNGKLAQLVEKLGRDESPQVAAFFVGSNDRFICQRMHDIGLLLNQAESFRTQWYTGRSMTATRAQQIDRTSSNFDAAQEAIRMLESRGEA